MQASPVCHGHLGEHVRSAWRE